MANVAPEAPVKEPIAPVAAPVIPVPAPAAPAPAPAKNVRERLGIRKKAATPPPAAAAPVAPAPAAPAPVVPKPAAAPAKKVETPATLKIDETKLGEAIARNLAPALQPKAPEQPEKKEPELSPVNERRLLVLRQMANDNPMLKTLPEEFLNAIENEKKYRAEWELKNKGKTFNPEDPEHADFFEKNDVTWDADEYDLARDKVIEAKSTGGATDALKPKFDALEEEKRAQAAVPQIIAHQATAAKLLFDKLGKDFEKVIKQDGEIDMAEVKRLRGENPIYNKIFPIAENTERVTGEIYRIYKFLTKFNPALPLHQEVANFVLSKELEIRALPEEKQKSADGKPFATTAEWLKMDEKQRAAHWHLDENDLSAVYAAEKAAEAKKIIDDEENNFKTLAEKRGLKSAGSEIVPAPKNGEQPKTPENIPPAPPSPAGVSVPRLTPPTNRAPNAKTSVFQRLRGYK
jgi:hypothetical protein